MSNLQKKKSTWWRWLLVLPAAFAGYFVARLFVGSMMAIQTFIGLDVSTRFDLLFRECASAWAFVAAGSHTAPTYRFSTSIIMAVIFTGFVIFDLCFNNENLPAFFIFVSSAMIVTCAATSFGFYFKETE